MNKKIIKFCTIVIMLLNSGVHANDNMQKLLEIYVYSILVEVEDNNASIEQIRSLDYLKGYAIYPVNSASNKRFVRIGFFSLKKCKLKSLERISH